jgi:hypothetical protein
MPELNLFLIFTSRLNGMAVRYMVTGAVAAIIYGEPRLTNDIDLVIELKAQDIGKIEKSFPPQEFYFPPVESLNIEANRSLRGHFNIIHHETGFKADFYLMGRDELHHWGMENRREYKIEGQALWLAPPEYVILRKLEYYKEGRSEKHLRDIAGMLALSSAQIDFNQLQERIKSHGLEKEWTEARKMAE